MFGRTQLWLAGAGLCLAIVLFFIGFKSVAVWRPEPGRVAWTLPYGSQLKAVAVGNGQDGKKYGPLAFSVTGGSGNRTTLVIADTYNDRILTLHHGQAKAISVPGRFLEDVYAEDPDQVLATDNLNGVVLRISAGKVRSLITLPHRRGYTATVWAIAANSDANLWVEWIRVGHGLIHTEVDRYPLATLKPTPILSESQISWLGVSQSGDLYVQPLWDGAHALTIRVYDQAGQYRRTLVLKVPSRYHGAQLLGVDSLGDLFMDMHTSATASGPVLVYNQRAHLIATLGRPQKSIGSWIPGYVRPNGTLYVMDGRRDRLQIVRYRWHQVRGWSWQLW